MISVVMATTASDAAKAVNALRGFSNGDQDARSSKTTSALQKVQKETMVMVLSLRII